MGSVAKRTCARGSRCAGFARLGGPVRIRASSKDDFCDLCRSEHGDALGGPGAPKWVPEVLEAVEAAHRLAGAPRGKASLWDMLELDPFNLGRHGHADLGDVLSRLSVPASLKVADWLDENRGPATERVGHPRWFTLWSFTRLSARMRELVSDGPLAPVGPEPGGLPASGTAYTSTGRAIDIMMPFKVEMLRRRPGYVSERALARALGMKRSTLRDMLARMEEKGFSLGEKHSADELAYIAGAGLRGRRKSVDRPQA